MNEQQLFIPNNISVGFQKRDDTYTKKLAFVVAYDLKGVRRKEKSWDGWRDQKIPSIDYDNTPTEGFVLNKGVGGARASYGWNARNEYIRVYDPRDFEFEISVANLLFILREGDCSRGKGLEGKFVYAWDRDKLVLLPVASADYQHSKNFTQLQDKNVAAKDLVLGASYTTRKQQELTYLGRFHVYANDHYVKWSKSHYITPINKPVKQHIFWDGETFVFLKDVKTIAVRNGDTIAPDYAELVDAYNKSETGSKVVKIYTKPNAGKKYKGQDKYYNYHAYWVSPQTDGTWIEANTVMEREWVQGTGNVDTGKIDSIQTIRKISLKNGVLHVDPYHFVAYPVGKPKPNNYWDNVISWIEPTKLRLYVELESGSEYALINGNLVREK